MTDSLSVKPIDTMMGLVYSFVSETLDFTRNCNIIKPNLTFLCIEKKILSNK